MDDSDGWLSAGLDDDDDDDDDVWFPKFLYNTSKKRKVKTWKVKTPNYKGGRYSFPLK